MSRFDEVREQLRQAPLRFVVTGAAGFIGSHLTEALLRLGQTVVGLDNFATGTRRNIAEATGTLTPDERARFRLVEGDIRAYDACAAAVRGADVVLHQAALASVPRSMEDPLSTHSVNVDGFVNVLLASQSARVRRVVYASSSSVYGDDTGQPKIETRVGHPLSPYAATKAIDEMYASVFQRTHGIRSVGLRYFNVFGPRQDPMGPYAAVIPRWVESLLKGDPCVVFGDGSASRDFCFVDNVVQANLLAACTPDDVFNVACGARLTLSELFDVIRAGAAVHRAGAQGARLQLGAARAGDILHSFASIDRARDVLGYEPTWSATEGLRETIDWSALRISPRGAVHAGTGDPSP